MFFFSFYPSWASPYDAYAHPLKKERKLHPSDHATIPLLRRKTPSLQPLRPERKTVSIPIECLDHVAWLIEKDKERSVHRVVF